MVDSASDNSKQVGLCPENRQTILVKSFLREGIGLLRDLGGLLKDLGGLGVDLYDKQRAKGTLC